MARAQGVYAWMPGWMREALKRLAREQGRETISAQVRHYVREGLRRDGVDQEGA